jgi:hypothetical protein
LEDLSATLEEKLTFVAKAVVSPALYEDAVATREQAKVNLERTQIRSPVNGWVTNLLAQAGDTRMSVEISFRSSIPDRSYQGCQASPVSIGKFALPALSTFDWPERPEESSSCVLARKLPTRNDASV